MGWDEYRATNYKKNGEVDRKAECRDAFNSENYGLVKDSMVGSTYYGAYRHKASGNVFAVIALTHASKRGYFNFAIKSMDESVGPCSYDCPLFILDCLTEPSNEWAREWREKCREKARQKKAHSLAALPYGTMIRFQWNGREIRLIKQEPAYQFKTYWFYENSGHYFPKSRIPESWEVYDNKAKAC